MKSPSPDTKSKILKNAEILFAKQGYDATSMDQIAAKAGVNKALIYYYYKSKTGLRSALFAHVQQDMIDFMDQSLSGVSAKQLRRLSSADAKKAVAVFSHEYLEQFIRAMIDFLEEHHDALKLVMMESYKTTSDYPAIFGFFETIFRDQLDKIKAKGVPYSSGARELIYEFFTGFIPMLTFIIFHDQWARHFKVSEEKVKREFMESFIKTHVLNTEYRLQQKERKTP